LTPNESAAWRPEIDGWSLDILPFYRDFLVPRLPAVPAHCTVGVYHGRDLCFFAEELARVGKGAEGATRAMVYGVDPGEHGSRDRMTEHIRRLTGEGAFRTGAGFDVGIETYGFRSVEGARLFRKHQLDSCFIDAEHTKPALREDVEAWIEKIKPGGWLCGHDYGHELHPGVAAAIDELAGRPNVIIRETCWAWQVPEYVGCSALEALWKRPPPAMPKPWPWPAP
jgi:Methyltransferase domain